MKTYTPEQIRQAGKDGEISSIDVEHLISLLPTEEEGIKEDADHQIKISELREKFFKECTENEFAFKYEPKLTKDPHDLFEWFKPYLKIPSIDWEGLEEHFLGDGTFGRGGFTEWLFEPKEAINWLKTNLLNYIK